MFVEHVHDESVFVPDNIKNAKTGSLAHILTEKIAYYLYEKDPHRDPDENWSRAQYYFGRWFTGRFGEYLYPFSRFLEEMLEINEKSLRERGENIKDVAYHLASTIVVANESGHPITRVL